MTIVINMTTISKRQGGGEYELDGMDDGLILTVAAIAMYIIGQVLWSLFCLLMGAIVLLFSASFEKAVRIPLLLLLLRALLPVVWELIKITA